MSVVTTRLEGAVGVILVNNPPVNALGQAVRAGILAALGTLEADPACEAIVIGASGRTFMAGADITEFGKPPVPPGLGDVIEALERAAKPVVAALHGTALGGGLEVALGCHYRVAVASAKLGLPEVKLGIIPGAGGTQRLPRVVGVEKALDMIVSGAPIGADEALACGLLDAVVTGDPTAAAISWTAGLVRRGGAPRRTSERAIDPASAPADVFSAKRASLRRHPSGPQAPLACIDAVEGATRLPFPEGLALESKLFRECLGGPYAPALQHVFFAERKAATIPDIGKEVAPRAVESVGVIGAGTMGAGIAMNFLNAGIPVTIVETRQEALTRGVATIRSTYDSLVSRGRLAAEEADSRMERLTPALELDSLGGCDLVIEAAFEEMAVKTDIFARLDAIAKPRAILATNTSTLDVNVIAAATQRPADVLGLHFFSPANIMKLLEVVRADETAKDVMATAMTLARRIGKVAVPAGVCFGFIGNRMLEAYGGEAQALALEGAKPAEVDGAMERWGLAMGPFAMSDLAGLDVGYRIRKERTLTNEQKARYSFADGVVEQGRLGQKSGKGYYRYEGRTRVTDPEVEAFAAARAAALGVAQRSISETEILERLLFALVNEGAKILTEGVALRSGDIDTIYVNGYGFPAWRGGPMWAADVMGLSHVAERVKAFHAEHGVRWTPAPLLLELAESGRTFASLDVR